MRRSSITTVASVLCLLAISTASSIWRSDNGSQRHIVDPPIHRLERRSSALPIFFEENVGQSDPHVRFLTHARGSTVFITEDGATLVLGAQIPTQRDRRGDSNLVKRRAQTGASLKMRLLDPSDRKRVEGSGSIAGRVNYFIGRDPSKWHRNVPTVNEVIERGVWPGIDIRYHSSTERPAAIECDFVAQPNADARKIRLAFDGANAASIASSGDLVLDVAGHEVRFLKPHIFEEHEAKRVEIAGRFNLSSTESAVRDRQHTPQFEVSFDVARLDRSTNLIIDPTLVYSTYLGGSGHTSAADQDFIPYQSLGDAVTAIAIDSSGNSYVGGTTSSPDFPVTPGAFQTACQNLLGCSTAFVAKLNPSGSSIVYATFLGGNGTADFLGYPPWDTVNGIVVNTKGEAYVAGTTYSTDFPTTQGAYQTSPGSVAGVTTSGFVTRLAGDGASLVASTYLTSPGGEGAANAITIDDAGNAYVTGHASANFPTTRNGIPAVGALSLQKAFIAELDPTLSSLLYGSLLGADSFGNAIALSKDGMIYVAGADSSGVVPTTSNAFQPTCTGCSEIGVDTTSPFLTLIDPSAKTWLTSLVYSTYFGGAGDGDFYSLDYAGDEPTGLAIDNSGRAFLTGYTTRISFPSTVGAFQSSCPNPYGISCSSSFVAILDPFAPTGAASVAYSTFLGNTTGDVNGATFAHGLAVEAIGRVGVVGYTYSHTFPTTLNAIQPGCPGCALPNAGAAFYVLLDPSLPTTQQLVYGTYLGGTATGRPFLNLDSGNAVTFDGAGSAYVVGTTFSEAFPVTAGAVQTVCSACTVNDFTGFVTKVGSDGSLVYSTFLGGSGFRVGGDASESISLDQAGNIYVAGLAASSDFPVSPGAQQGRCTVCGPTDSYNAFVAKIDPSASGEAQLVYATYLGGSSLMGDEAVSVAVDSGGNAYIAGNANSVDFPITTNAYETVCYSCAHGLGGSAFLSELDATGSRLIYSTFLNGRSGSSAAGIALDSFGKALVAGNTSSTDFPITGDAFQKYCPACAIGETDAFIAKIDTSASNPIDSLVYSTYLGGSGVLGSGDEDTAMAIAADNQDRAVVTGRAYSEDFPTTDNAFETTCPNVAFGECRAGFLAVVAPNASSSVQPQYSTFFPGLPTAVSVDAVGHPYVAGQGLTVMPTSTNAYQTSCSSGSSTDCPYNFVAALDWTLDRSSQLKYATFFGAAGSNITSLAADAGGNIYLTGSTEGNLPVTSDALQPTCLACIALNRNGGFPWPDAFLSELNPVAVGSSQLVYSSYLGGSGRVYWETGDQAYGIALDRLGHVAVTGYTSSLDFPVTSAALEPQCRACTNPGPLGGGTFGTGRDAFVAEFSFSTPQSTLSATPDPSPTALRTPTATPSATPTETATPTATATPMTKLIAVPQKFEFGKVVASATSKEKLLTLVNAGDTAAQIDQLSPPSAFLLAKDHCSHVSIAAKGKCTFSLTFAPQTPDGRSTTAFQVPYNGKSPIITLFGDALSATLTAPNLILLPTTKAGGKSTPKRITIENRTPITVLLNVANSIAPSFAIVSDNCAGVALLSKQKCNVSVSFTPGLGTDGDLLNATLTYGFTYGVNVNTVAIELKGKVTP